MGPEDANKGVFVSFVVPKKAPRFCHLNIYGNSPLKYTEEGNKTSQYSYLAVILSNWVPDNWVYRLPICCFESTVSVERTHWVLWQLGEFWENSVSWEKLGELLDTHLIGWENSLSSPSGTRWGPKNSLSSVFETVLSKPHLARFRAKIAARQFLPVTYHETALAAGAILREKLESLWAERQFGRHFKRHFGRAHLRVKRTAARQWGVNFCREAMRCLAGLWAELKGGGKTYRKHNIARMPSQRALRDI